MVFQAKLPTLGWLAELKRKGTFAWSRKWADLVKIFLTVDRYGAPGSNKIDSTERYRTKDESWVRDLSNQWERNKSHWVKDDRLT